MQAFGRLVADPFYAFLSHEEPKQPVAVPERPALREEALALQEFASIGSSSSIGSSGSSSSSSSSSGEY